jgi:hypothetical protein
VKSVTYFEHFNELCHDKTKILHLQPALIKIHAVRLQTLLQVEKLIANIMDQTAWMCRLVWIHAGRKSNMLVLSWHG